MRVKKVVSIINTKENEICSLNRSILNTHTKRRLQRKEKEISDENNKMFKRLYSIIVKDGPIKQNSQTIAPSPLRNKM